MIEEFHSPPTKPIMHEMYICDVKFHVDSLAAFLDPNETKKPPLRHGLIVTAGDEASFYTMEENTKPSMIKQIGMHRQKLQKKGGQSAARFSRIREDQIDSFVKLCVDTAIQCFTHEILPTVVTISLGGTGGASVGIYAQIHKSKAWRASALVKITLGCFVLSQLHVQNLWSASAHARSQWMQQSVSIAMQRFREHLRLDDGRAVYGPKVLVSALQQGCLELIITHSLDHALLENASDKTRCVVLDNPKHPEYDTLMHMGGIVAISFIAFYE